MDRYWVGGTATWDATAGTKWATTSGGAGGASVPTSADDVFFDGASGAVTVTVSASVNCLNLNFTGFTGTLTGSSTINIYGSITRVSGMTWSHTGNVVMQATSGSYTITNGGKSFGANLILGVLGLSTATWTLQDALILVNAVTITSGTFTTNDYNVTASSLSSSNSNVRTINLGSSTITLTSSAAFGLTVTTNLTFNAGTSTIVVTTSGGTFGTPTGATGLTFYNVSFTNTTANVGENITGQNTFNNLTVSGPSTAGAVFLNFADRTTINGTLSTTGTAGNRRVWFRGVTYGIAQTLTINSAPSLTDADFRDIYVIGTAAPISGTRIGDLRGCRGITFDAPKTVYWATAAGGNWSGNNWATSAGGAVSTDNFPLAQDTAVIENTGLNTSATVTLDSAVPYSGTVDGSARTNAWTLAGTATYTFYGDWTNGPNITHSGTRIFIFSGRNTQTIRCSSRAFPVNLTVDSYGGTVLLGDSFNIATFDLTITNGTFRTQDNSIVAADLLSANSNVRAIYLGSSTVTLSGSSPLDFTNSLDFYAGTSTLVFSASSPTFSGAGLTFYNLSSSSTASGGIFTVDGGTFNNLSITAPTAGIRAFDITANAVVNGTLTCSGASPVRRVFLNSGSSDTVTTLTVAAWSASPADVDFRNIALAGAVGTLSGTRFGDCGGNSGITFPAPKTVYWNLAGAQNISATAWCPSSGGTPDINNFPLAQDTAVFDNTGSVTGLITYNAFWNIGALDTSARTSAMSMILSGSPFIYGNFSLGSGVTLSATTAALTFAGAGTQTVTSSGKTIDQPIVIDCTGTVQLADALTMGSTRTLTFTIGTFVTGGYNITANAFASSSTQTRRLELGASTIILGSAGSAWNVGQTGSTIIPGTSHIILSNTSTTARSFTGGSKSYWKVTFGGATGIQTTTVAGSNSFAELASTKTVAHTLLFSGGTQQLVGKWSITGSLGNVVTVGSTTAAAAEILLYGPANTGIDYLSLSSVSVLPASPGEFYVGANSTNGGNNSGVVFTATPSPRTLYWVGGTGNWSSTAQWSTSSGGTSGASIPTSLDAVIFDSSSNVTAYTATIDVAARCASFNMSGPALGNVTFAGTSQLSTQGDFTLSATGITRTYTGPIFLSGNSPGKLFTTNGVALSNNVSIAGFGSSWALANATVFGTTNTGTLTVIAGDFSTANYSLTAASISSSTLPQCTLLLGSSTVTLTTNSTMLNLAGATLTFDAGTSSILGTGVSQTMNVPGQVFNSLSFTPTNNSSIGITGSATYANLSFAGLTTTSVCAISIIGNITVTGTLTLPIGLTAVSRTVFVSGTIGIPVTITAAAVNGSLADIDFRDITIAGAIAPISGTRFGDGGGNSGITFAAGTTKYWVRPSGGGWNETVWSSTSGGTPDINDVPLAQDTAVFEATGLSSGQTVIPVGNFFIGTIDMSDRTGNTMTFATGVTPVYVNGDFLCGSGVTLTGTQILFFTGSATQYVTSSGVILTQAVFISKVGGSVILNDSLTTTSTSGMVLNNGTINLNGYTLTIADFDSDTSNVRALTFGGGTIVVTGVGTIWDTSPSTGLTVTGPGSISFTGASSVKTVTTGTISYSGVTFNQGGSGQLSFAATSSTLGPITNTYSAVGATSIRFPTTLPLKVEGWSASGTASNQLTISGTSASVPANLVFVGSGQATAPTTDYLTITGVRAYSLDTTWYAGANSTNDGSLGWYFEAGGGGPISVFIIESATSADAQNNTATISVSMSETTTAADAAAAGLIYIGALNEAATASDVVEALRAFLASVAESATSSELVSAALTLAAAISELTIGADATAVTSRVTNPTIAELIAAADVLSGGLLFTTNISETSTGADSAAGANTTNPSVAEAATPSDALANANTTNPTISELITASETQTNTNTTNPTIAEAAQMADSLSGGLLFLSNISEATTAQEIATAVLIFNRAVSEATTASEVLAAVAAFNAAVPESVSGADVANALLTVGGSISEALTALDAAVGPKTTRPTISEAVAASESTANVYTANPVIAETASPLDAAQVVASTFSAASAETATPLDTPQAANTGSSSLSESATVSEAQAARFTAATAISEASTVQESQVAVFVATTRVNEGVNLSDAASVVPSVFSAIAAAVAQAIDDPSAPGSIYSATLPVESAGISDFLQGAYLWNPIDDTQVPNWQNVSNAQSVTWTEVSDTQNPGWVVIPTYND